MSEIFASCGICFGHFQTQPEKIKKSHSKVLFLTKDRDFEVGKVIKELEESNVEVYFNSNECIQRIDGLLA